MDMCEQYREQGYFVAENLLTDDEVEEIRQEMRMICAGRRGAIEGVLETETDEAPTDEVVAKYFRIHFPHKISEVILNHVKHPKVVDILTRLLGPNVKCMQSMIFMKHAGKPGQPWHQDEYYIPTRDRSLCGVWIALDRATVENGGLWVVPRSHQPGVIWPMHKHDNPEWNAGLETVGTPYDLEKDAIAVEIDPGSVIFFDGYLLHMSLRNHSEQRFRRTLVNHYMRAESMLPWDWDGRIELRHDMRDIVMVAGEDPYAWKGLEQVTYPFLRPEKTDHGARI